MTSPWIDAGVTRTRIKICGLRDIGMIEVAIEAGADAVGFVLAQDSPRTVPVEDALAMSCDLPPTVTPIGVVVDDDPALLARWSPRWIQFHGNEEEDAVAEYEGPVVRAFSFSIEAITRWDRCRHVDRLLVDAASPGSGTTFDHATLESLKEMPTTPLLVAGGLDASNVGSIIKQLEPWGVDVSSGVESSPGVKDPGLIRAFCQAVKDASSP